MASPRRMKQLIVDELTVDTIKLNDNTNVVTALLLASGQVVDLNGESDALILDAAQNVRLDGSSTGKLRVKISGAYDFEFLANIFRALSGSVVETNTINETTAASGVTVDGVLLKDGGAVFADGATIEIDTVNEATAAHGVIADGVLLKDGGMVLADGASAEADIINEATADAGVTVDGALIKDGAVPTRETVTLASGDAAISAKDGTVVITKGSAAALTLANPTAGTDDGKVLKIISRTAFAHKVDNSAGAGFNGGGGSVDVATFGGAVGDNMVLFADNGKWLVLNLRNVTIGAT